MFTGSSRNIFEEKQSGKKLIDSNEVLQSKLYPLLQALGLGLQLAPSFHLLKLFKYFLLSFCSSFCFSLAIRQTVLVSVGYLDGSSTHQLFIGSFVELCRFSFKDWYLQAVGVELRFLRCMDSTELGRGFLSS